jgi:hypothetical protein
MATTVYTIELKSKDGDEAFTTALSSGSAVTAMTCTEDDGVLTVTCTT